MKAAKEKMFLLVFVVLTMFTCAPSFASATALEASKPRAELKSNLAENRVEQSPFYSVKRDVNYDSSWEVASESSVAPRSVPSHLTSHANAHTLGRHGGAVTDSQLITRARTGVAPDGSTLAGNRIPPISSAFHSDDALLRADSVLRGGRLQQEIAANPGATSLTFKFDVGENSGRGFRRIGSSNPRNVNLLGPVQRIDNITRTSDGCAKFNYRSLGNDYDVPGVTMNYELKFPKLVRLLKTLTVDHNYCDEQFAMFVQMGLKEDESLASEIQTAFDDDMVSWKELLNNDVVGDVFDTDDESDAKQFALDYLLGPAQQFLSELQQ